MEPANFDQANLTLGPPPGVSEDEVRSLRVFRGVTPEGRPCFVACFKPTAEDLDRIRSTGRVFLMILGTAFPPVSLSTESPFADQTEAERLYPMNQLSDPAPSGIRVHVGEAGAERCKRWPRDAEVPVVGSSLELAADSFNPALPAGGKTRVALRFATSLGHACVMTTAEDLVAAANRALLGRMGLLGDQLGRTVVADVPSALQPDDSDPGDEHRDPPAAAAAAQASSASPAPVLQSRASSSRHIRPAAPLRRTVSLGEPDPDSPSAGSSGSAASSGSAGSPTT